jgi:hypothetical protein
MDSNNADSERKKLESTGPRNAEDAPEGDGAVRNDEACG